MLLLFAILFSWQFNDSHCIATSEQSVLLGKIAMRVHTFSSVQGFTLLVKRNKHSSNQRLVCLVTLLHFNFAVDNPYGYHSVWANTIRFCSDAPSHCDSLVPDLTIVTGDSRLPVLLILSLGNRGCPQFTISTELGFVPGGGRYMTCGWTGVCRPVFKKLPSSNYRQLPSYPLLWWLLAENYPFLTIFCQSIEKPPMFKENLLKKGPLFREFWTQKPTHMGGTYPYPQHVMLPPPPPGGLSSFKSGHVLPNENNDYYNDQSKVNRDIYSKNGCPSALGISNLPWIFVWLIVLLLK